MQVPPSESPPSVEDATARLIELEPWLRRHVALELRRRSVLAACVDSEDLVQDVLVGACEKLDASVLVHGEPPAWWTTQERLRAYLGGVVRRSLARAIRASWSRRQVTLPGSTSEVEAPASRSEPGSVSRSGQVWLRFERCLRRLPNGGRSVLRLLALGFDLRRIAAREGISYVAAEKRRTRGLRDLRWLCARCRRGDDCCFGPLDDRTRAGLAPGPSRSSRT